jgi:hypothetical protein
MKPKLFVIVAIYFWALTGVRAGTVSLETNEIAALRELVATNPEAAEQFSRLQRKAEKTLTDIPDPIEKIVSEGHLDKDPLKIRTGKSLDDMEKITALGWAWAVTGDKRYAVKAREFILAWARTNHSDGDAINETKFESLIVAYDLLRDTFPADDRRKVDDWLHQKAEKLWTDHRGLKNNWYSHRLKIVGLIGWTLRDRKLITDAVNGFHQHIGRNLKPDGASIDFYERDALHYHVYDVEPLLVLARVAERNGENFFDYAGTNGATLQAGVVFLVPFAEGSKTHIEFVKSKVPFDHKRAANGQGEYAPHLWEPASAVNLFCDAAWFRPEYGALAARLAGQPGKTYFNWRMVLNAVSGHAPAVKS